MGKENLFDSNSIDVDGELVIELLPFREHLSSQLSSILLNSLEIYLKFNTIFFIFQRN